MCSHYQAIKDRPKFEKAFNVKLPPYEGVNDVWPLFQAFFVRRPLAADAGDDAVPAREALPGVFGLIPSWAKDDKFARRTFNARSETATTLPSFRDAWRKGHKCINADDHALMRRYHKPADEKRMVVILPEASYTDWLTAPASQNKAFLQQYPADRMVAESRAVG